MVGRHAIEPREEERRGREVTIDVPAVMRGKGFVLYASEGKLMKIGRERGLTRRGGCRDTVSIAAWESVR